MTRGPGREGAFESAVGLAPGRAMSSRRLRVEAGLRLAAGASLAVAAIVTGAVVLGVVAAGLIVWAAVGYRRTDG